VVKIAYGSQPFFADLNGDLKNEMIYNDPLLRRVMVATPSNASSDP
jgi:hypothetical protein